jgi:hypothetical protein
MNPGSARAAFYTLLRMETKRMPRSLVLFLMGVFAPSALWAGGEPPPTGMAPPKRVPQLPAPLPPSEGVPTASVPREVRRAVVADAARRLKVPENLVVLASAERLTWNDGALGCPTPGMSYAQALVPGYRIVAKSTGGSFIYHTDAGGNLAVCDTQLQRQQHGGAKVAPKPVEPVAEPPPERTVPDR